MSTPVALVRPEPERTSVEPFSSASRRLTLSLPQISGQRPTSLLPHSFPSGRSSRISKREREEDPEVTEEEVEVEEAAEAAIEEEAEAAQEAAEVALDQEEVHEHNPYQLDELRLG